MLQALLVGALALFVALFYFQHPGSDPVIGWSMDDSYAHPLGVPGGSTRPEPSNAQHWMIRQCQYDVLNPGEDAYANVELKVVLPGRLLSPDGVEDVAVTPVGTVHLELRPHPGNPERTDCIVIPAIGSDHSLAPGQKMGLRFMTAKEGWNPVFGESEVTLPGNRQFLLQDKAFVQPSPPKQAGWLLLAVAMIIFLAVTVSFFVFVYRLARIFR